MNIINGAHFFCFVFFSKKNESIKTKCGPLLKQPHELVIQKRNYLVNIIKGANFFCFVFFPKKMKI